MRVSTATERNSRLTFRVSTLEKKAIEIIAQKIGLSVSDFLRHAALQKRSQSQLSKNELKVYLLLVELRDDIESIKHLIKRGEDFPQKLQKLISQIDLQLKKFIS